MPDLATHLRQAHHNEQFFLSFDRGIYSDWAMTVLYYAALQYVDALLAHLGILDPGGHDVRECHIRSRNELRPIHREYFRLKSRSRNARYYARHFRPEEIDRCRTTDFETIKQHVRGLLP